LCRLDEDEERVYRLASESRHIPTLNRQSGTMGRRLEEVMADIRERLDDDLDAIFALGAFAARIGFLATYIQEAGEINSRGGDADATESLSELSQISARLGMT